MRRGYRKSKTIGGVRFTASKSGLTTSIGGKGWRVSQGKRGTRVTTSIPATRGSRRSRVSTNNESPTAWDIFAAIAKTLAVPILVIVAVIALAIFM